MFLLLLAIFDFYWFIMIGSLWLLSFLIYLYQNCESALFWIFSSIHFLRDVLREKCPNTEFFLSVFSCIQIEYGDLLRKSPYSVRMQENTDQKKLCIVFGHFSRSDEVGNANMNKQTVLVQYSAASCTAWKVSILGIILVRIFPHLDWIRRDIPCLSVYSSNVGKCGPE